MPYVLPNNFPPAAQALSAAKLRPAFLGKGARPFLGILGGEHPAVEGIAALAHLPEETGFTLLFTLYHDFFHGLDSQRRPFADVLPHLQRSSHQPNATN